MISSEAGIKKKQGKKYNVRIPFLSISDESKTITYKKTTAKYCKF